MIIVNLDVMMARRKMSLNELSDRVGITVANLSILKTGRPRPCASPPSTPSAAPWTAAPATSSNTNPTLSKTSISSLTRH